MTGPEHYREAESDRDAAARASDKGRQDDAMFWLLSAQVHAALAQAAATALRLHYTPEDGNPDLRAWCKAASERAPEVPA
jgi:hypothetical protein